ncbi:hypothetical protein PV05_05828 [Exophiala xenobiotica]|uniref:Uncharacterized protein n=1 Tax=Exophiala xenobiotica TaxID=348802 RepID=A0A0D2D4H0_9EURO|nr:uncharacterized protein PV05_05828 [Exophiala xenobiotica]KIW57252.1 hypothetical protein PV05_05828 [Exophiala xenobiotica]
MKASSTFRASGHAKATLLQHRVSRGISKPVRSPPPPKNPSHAPTKKPNDFNPLSTRTRLSKSPIPAFKSGSRLAPRAKAFTLSLPRLLHFLDSPELKEESEEPPQAAYHSGGCQQATVGAQEPQHPTACARSQDPFRPAEVYRAPGLRGGDSVWACPCFRPQQRSDSWGATHHLRRQDAIREGRSFQLPPMVAPELPPLPEDERCAYCRGWATPMDLDDPLEMQQPRAVVEYDDLMDVD